MESEVPELQRRIHYIVSGDNTTNVQPNSADVALIIDTYHHFEYPAEMMHSIHETLKPRARLYLVDFHRIVGVSSEWVLGHVRAGSDVFRSEVESAGFRFVRDWSSEAELSTNYCFEFSKA